MQIRFTRSWRRRVPGQVIEETDGVANVLIRRGIAEEVVPEPKKKTPRRKKVKRK